MEITRINNNINGNPRFVIHFLSFITNEENKLAWEMDHNNKIESAISYQYELALKKAKKFGGKKYHNKQFGGGIVFQAYNRNEILEIIFQVIGNEMFDSYIYDAKDLFIHSMGKQIEVKAIFDDTDICNLFLKYNVNMGVIKQFDGSIFVAEINDK